MSLAGVCRVPIHSNRIADQAFKAASTTSASLSQDGGSIFVESMQPRNPTFLDGAKLKTGIRYPLNAGSSLQVGRVALTFNIIS